MLLHRKQLSIQINDIVIILGHFLHKLRWFEVYLGALNDLVSNCLLHKVHLALPNYLHQLVLKRDRQFALGLHLGPGTML